jgi:hypothetical protein
MLSIIVHQLYLFMAPFLARFLKKYLNFEVTHEQTSIKSSSLFKPEENLTLSFLAIT